jgi:hypothetical protein
MQEMLARLVDVPMARMFILTGIIFLLIAVLGRIEGKIEPGNVGRIGATVVGILLTASGLAMYFFEGDMIREGFRAVERANSEGAKAGREMASGRNGASRPVPGLPSAGAAEPAIKDGPAIKVVAATYGRNCAAKAGNATAQLARECDGRLACDFRIDIGALEDPAPKCDKDYVAEWKCGTGSTVYTVTMPPGAAQSEPLRLACSRG